MFKFPGTGWQQKRGFSTDMITDNDKCIVCDLKHDVGWNPEDESPRYIVCERHSHCQQFVIRMIARLRERHEKVSLEEFAACRLNSWDRDALIPHMADELLAEQTEYTLKNCSRFLNPAGPAATYDEALQLYAKELTKRLNITRRVDDEEVPAVRS